MRARIVTGVVLVAVVVALVVGVWPDSAPLTNDARAQQIAEGIRCPTCQGLSVAESDSPLAQSSQAEIDARVAQGQSEQQIREYFVSRYGPTALTSPEKTGFTLLAWVAPVLFVLLAAAALVFTVRRWRRAPVPDDAPAPEIDPPRPAVSHDSAGSLRNSTGMKKPPKAAILGCVVFVVAAIALVANLADQREAGETTTGNIAEDTNTLLASAQQQTARGEAADALKTYDKVLQLDPNNAQALAYRGWLLRLAGLSDEGLASIDRSIAAQPNYADAHFFRGFILLRDRNQPADAVRELETFKTLSPPPEMVPLVDQALAEARSRASG